MNKLQEQKLRKKVRDIIKEERAKLTEAKADFSAKDGNVMITLKGVHKLDPDESTSSELYTAIGKLMKQKKFAKLNPIDVTVKFKK